MTEKKFKSFIYGMIVFAFMASLGALCVSGGYKAKAMAPLKMETRIHVRSIMKITPPPEIMVLIPK